MGSTREVQSLDEGGRSIHSSRWGFEGGGGEGVWCSPVVEVRADWLPEGREGPMSESESESEAAGSVVGRSESGAGGRKGPITPGGEVGEVLRERLAGGSAVPASGVAERLRFERSSGGRVGPMVVIVEAVRRTKTWCLECHCTAKAGAKPVSPDCLPKAIGFKLLAP